MLLLLAVGLLLYGVAVAVYRVYLSPLSRVPGSKIAALTSWYCAYHDIVRGGQYIWVVDEMHRRHGPIVRTMPDVLHVNDPSFIDTLYPSSTLHRRERSWTLLNPMLKSDSLFGTRDHNLHRQRRAVMSRFFSQQNVQRLTPVIDETLGDLLRRLDGWADADELVSLNRIFMAAVTDVMLVYGLGESRKCLHMDDCNAHLLDFLVIGREIHVDKHLPWLSVLMCKLPVSFLTAMNPSLAVFVQFLEDLTKRIQDCREDKREGTAIFNQILRSDVPEAEKQPSRLADEAKDLLFAASMTTASTMVAVAYHILSDLTISRRLREELESAVPDADQPLNPDRLRSLPFLNALVEEGLRLYAPATHRQDRVAPDEDLIYRYPDGRTLVIPAGTSIGMTAPLINRHPDLYDSPDEFRPDRYLDDPGLMRRHLTFSRGARQCLGMILAYQELRTLIAGVFRRYRVYDPQADNQGGPTLELCETTVDDVRLHADYMTPKACPGSKGVRVRIRS